MKAIIAALFLILTGAIGALAQNEVRAADVEAGACGPWKIQFDVQNDPTDHPMTEPEAGKALVYVIQDLGDEPSSGPVTRIGLDGAWVGAGKGRSYFSFSVDPGEHHLCLNWQSRLASRSNAVALMGFTAEVGKTYYFRGRLFFAHTDDVFEHNKVRVLDLDPLNSDEAKLLIAQSPLSRPHQKK